MAGSFNNRNGRVSTGLALVVGALVVLVAVLGYYVYNDGWGNDDVVIRIDGGGSALDGAVDALEDAAESVGDAVRGN